MLLVRWNMPIMIGVSTRLQKDLGRPQKELDLYAKRAMNYKNLFDKETKLMRGKNKDGNFMAPFSPLKWEMLLQKGIAGIIHGRFFTIRRD